MAEAAKAQAAYAQEWVKQQKATLQASMNEQNDEVFQSKQIDIWRTRAAFYQQVYNREATQAELAQRRYSALELELGETAAAYKAEVAAIVEEGIKKGQAIGSVEFRVGMEFKLNMNKREKTQKKESAYIDMVIQQVEEQQVLRCLDFALEIQASWIRIKEKIHPATQPTESKPGH